MIADSKNFNRVKFPIGVLPADSFIKDISQDIKESDTIIVSGAVYKLTAVSNNNNKEPITHCLAMKMFYLTDLAIE